MMRDHFTEQVEKPGDNLSKTLVGGLNPSEKYESQLGYIGMIIPNVWENKTWQPNHQPVSH